jgi:hypothetical protein
VTAAFPQQIAHAAILSMLSAVATPVPSGPEPEQTHIEPVVERSRPTKTLADEEAEIPDFPEPSVDSFVARQPEAPPLAGPVDPSAELESGPKARLPYVPQIPIAAAPASKTSPEAPVAFELRLTQEQPEAPDQMELPAAEEIRTKRERAEHPRIQRKEAASLASGSHEAPLPHRSLPILINVTATPASRETQAIDPPKFQAPEVPTNPVPIEDSKPLVQTATVREIEMRVSTPDSKPVDVRISGRSGEVQVAVRTTDPVLKTSLQSDLGSLVSRLEQSGFRTETHIPEDARPIPESDRIVAGQAIVTAATAELSGSGTYGEPRDAHGESNGRESSPDSRHSNDRQQQQQQHRRSTRAWEQMMEDVQ